MWPWRSQQGRSDRTERPDQPAAAPPADGPPAVWSAPPRAEWRALPAIQRAVGGDLRINPPERLSDALTSWRDPRYLAPLGHTIGADEPSGFIGDPAPAPIPAPVPRARDDGPDLPLVSEPAAQPAGWSATAALTRFVQRMTVGWPGNQSDEAQPADRPAAPGPADRPVALPTAAAPASAGVVQRHRSDQPEAVPGSGSARPTEPARNLQRLDVAQALSAGAPPEPPVSSAAPPIVSMAPPLADATLIEAPATHPETPATLFETPAGRAETPATAGRSETGASGEAPVVARTLMGDSAGAAAVRVTAARVDAATREPVGPVAGESRPTVPGGAAAVQRTLGDPIQPSARLAAAAAMNDRQRPSEASPREVTGPFDSPAPIQRIPAENPPSPGTADRGGRGRRLGLGAPIMPDAVPPPAPIQRYEGPAGPPPAVAQRAAPIAGAPDPAPTAVPDSPAATAVPNDDAVAAGTADVAGFEAGTPSVTPSDPGGPEPAAVLTDLAEAGYPDAPTLGVQRLVPPSEGSGSAASTDPAESTAQRATDGLTLAGAPNGGAPLDPARTGGSPSGRTVEQPPPVVARLIGDRPLPSVGADFGAGVGNATGSGLGHRNGNGSSAPAAGALGGHAGSLTNVDSGATTAWFDRDPVELASGSGITVQTFAGSPADGDLGAAGGPGLFPGGVGTLARPATRIDPEAWRHGPPLQRFKLPDSAVSTLPNLPALPSAPALPSMPGLPSMPSMPTAAVPAVPEAVEQAAGGAVELPPVTMVRQSEPADPAPSPAGPAAASGVGSAATPEELVEKLFDPLLRRLKSELLVDRDRRGSLTDLRR